MRRQLGAAQPLLGIVAVDQLLKRIALLILPEQEAVQGDAMLQFVLRLNSSGVGSWVSSAFPAETMDAITGDVGGIAGNALVALMLVLAHRRKAHLFWGLLLGCALAVPLALALSSIQSTYALSPGTLKSLLVAELWSSVALHVTLWILLKVKGSLWRFPVGFLAAAGASNSLDLLLPPHAVVDYIYSSLISGLFGFGVFNLADVAYLLAIGMCLILGLRTVHHVARWLSAWLHLR
ncbi:MAG: signal peptidase II [Polyangiaceae bacterium]|nr:signal peptidase II [Polyangiaceae bacterium]